MSKPLIEIQKLGVEFPHHPVFHNLDFTIHQGDFISVIGENGVGKTTLIRTILGLLKPTSGSIKYHPNRKAIRIGYVPQFRNIDEEYPLTIEDFIGLNTSGWQPWLSKQDHQLVTDAMQQTDLLPIRERQLGMASGGEKQRAYLAQAIVEDPQLLILDESTASLDNEMKFELLDLVKELNQKGLTVFFVTHDLPLAKQYSHQYLALRHQEYDFGEMAAMELDDLKEATNV